MVLLIYEEFEYAIMRSDIKKEKKKYHTGATLSVQFSGTQVSRMDFHIVAIGIFAPAIGNCLLNVCNIINGIRAPVRRQVLLP